ncbi:GNAT family N-acetyltransferase [Nakamurella sp. YIM 132087]|uniref:GNAT family N-acetyltransferase n=1 Tax=Nakamurella alba TaxID=2665158 RepID=A0A7K1FHW7_9ACTN|nr:GNAT family N-acetyltransferase [Nakamurella alba]MTD13711.1 GNAT family N-acetyltransferase [Nakamurella alba]
MSLQSRPLEKSDAPAMVEIIAEMEALEPADEFWDVEEVLEEFDSPTTDAARGTVGITDGDRLVAFGSLSISQPVGVWKAGLFGGVRTDYLEQGLGRRLLDELTAGATAIRDADHPGMPGELKIWVRDRRPRLTRLAKSAGYEPWRYFQDMRHTLGDLPELPPAPAGIEILPWSPDLDDSTLVASNDSFADHWGSAPIDPVRWKSYFADSSSFRGADSLVAVDEQGVVAFVLVEEFPAETAALGFRVGYIARVGTARRGRGRGLATTLLIHSLHRLQAQGYEYAELNVDSDSPTGAGRLYRRIGFEPTHLNTTYGRRF